MFEMDFTDHEVNDTKHLTCITVPPRFCAMNAKPIPAPPNTATIEV
jgi:hypothetical protein